MIGNQYLEETICTPMVTAAYFTIARNRNNLSIHQQRTGYRKCSVCGIFSLRKRRESFHCDNMDEAGGHNAKWNKPDRKGQTPHAIIYMGNL